MAKDEYEKQFDRFRKDVAGHTVSVLREDGLYRHLRCAREGSYSYSFDIITWPGYLCYCGDMGSYVFSRLRDMFEFFRGRQTAVIDRGYLAEKAVAVDKPDGLREFSEERFEACVRSDFDSFTEEWADGDKSALWNEIEEEVLPAASDGMRSAVDAAVQFRHKGRCVFEDFWEHSLEEYTARFWWCCYAVPWAIEQYDKARIEAPALPAGREA